ncbi:hypothetical protein J2S43_006577 [Catenuloplanes nepalensis]|uniref:Uncharacterized protein n=1 Tax=Catenuloplanes nepalensis TaxID=587533 RepID=A0ABT9N2Y1_9ACTN|nr:hypothetical protein [Catenuloplanes nepalensis]MDP9798065.1 hypothetical protein [Catenuloplanes nepalensis]
MPTRVLLEGPAIEPLLEQVRREYGTSVRIISADKVRTGGFGGFFAKQKYELSVEVPDDVMAGRPSGGHGAGPGGGFAGGGGLSGGGGFAGGGGFSGGGPEPAPREKPVDTLAALLERADKDGFARAAAREEQNDQMVRNPYGHGGSGHGGGELPARAGLVSTASPAFAEIMAGLESGHLTRAPAERAVTVGAPAVHPAVTPSAPSGGAAPVIDVPLKPAAPTVRPYRPPAAISPDGPPAPGGPMVSPALLEQLIAETNPLAPVVSQPAPAPPPMSTPMATATMAPEAPIIPAAPAPPERSALVPVHPALPAVPQKAPEVLAPEIVVAPQAAPAPPEPKPAAEPAPVAEVVRSPIAEKLIALGMPAEMAERATGTDAYGGVLEALADLPPRPQPPARAGDVLVVAGELSHALPVARKVIEQLRLDASRLLLAGPSASGTGIHPSRKISGPSAAEKKARKIHRGDTPYVVVLDAPVNEPNEEWVRDVCDAIGATEVWAAVDATRKTADTRRHLTSMGDVDAVAVYGTAVTADPATVLGLEVPIFMIDGQDASPHAWAAMLCQRLTRSEKKSTRKRRR